MRCSGMQAETVRGAPDLIGALDGEAHRVCSAEVARPRDLGGGEATEDPGKDVRTRPLGERIPS